ncbi:MAG: MATE family efflux transporter [Clostridiales bacterium]|nr:MAG: MATE family efflux transporter [Clostridiales bacterium]PWL70635.1 MAG: MATE family efflux transporter [Clostridiales bacterium]
MRIQLSEHFSYKKLLRFVFPTVIMMIVSSVYSIVDGFFVSNFVGKNAFAAVNLIMPVLMALGALGFMIGTGGSALVAKTLGEGNRQKANQYFTMLIYVLVIAGVVLSVIGFILMRPLAVLLGASEAILEDCVLYGRVLIVSNTFFMLQNSFQSFLVTAEKPLAGLLISVLAGVSNIIFDFLLVYVVPMGVFGAALATAISQVVGGLVPVIYFLRRNNSLLQFVKAPVNFKALWRACANGSSEMLTNLSTSFVGMLYNFQLIRIAAENGVAAYGVIMYVNFIFMGFFFGYTIGCGPIVGYHYGAANTRELKNLFRKSLVITAAASVLMTVLGVALAEPLAKLFVSYDTELLEMTANGMRLYALSFLLCGFNIFGSAFFTALGNGALSALISFLRTLVIQIAAILILPAVWGINGVWLAIVAAEGLTLILTAALFILYRKRYQYA